MLDISDPLHYRYAVDVDVYLLNTYTRTVTSTVAMVYNDYREVAAGAVRLDSLPAMSVKAAKFEDTPRTVPWNDRACEPVYVRRAR